MRRYLRILLVSVLASASCPLAAADGNPMTDSLPRTEGRIELAGLGAPVEIARDALAIPVIRGESLRDVIRAEGYIHAQERYVQMDLGRRAAAGEMAEIGGTLVIDADRYFRRYRFREVARQVVASMEADKRRLLEAYAEGVNAGLADLGAPPPEYRILQAEPEPWLAEDSILVALAMFETLQGARHTEPMVAVMTETLPPVLVDFLLPSRSRFDVPILPDGADGNGYEPLVIPGPEVIDLRRKVGVSETKGVVQVDAAELVIGSNNWAVAGSRSVHGGAIVANDMHLALTSPGVWYRAQLEWGDRSAGGLTLPGVPGLITGSNGRVAWGFTNTTGDFQDYIVIEVNPENPEQYRTPDGWENFGTIDETIAVRGRKAESLTLRNTRWGIVTEEDWRGRPLVLKWVALMPVAVNMNLIDMMLVDSVKQGMAAARSFGMPSQNIVMGDADGHVGWIVSGYLPRRVGYLGMRPRSWADGTCTWDGPVDESLRPTLTDPVEGVIYTANNRTIQDETGLLFGHAWASGYRAYRIKQLLDEQETFSERDLLAIQLDTRSILFDFYRDLILEATRGTKDEILLEVRAIVAEWDGTADVDQPALRLLDAYRQRVHAKVFGPLTRACRAVDPGFRYRWSFAEETLRRILEERPDHLLPPPHASWRDLLRSALRDAVDDLARRNPKLTLQSPWGDANRASIGHPLGSLSPQFGQNLRMPHDPLPGHWSTVRMATPGFGASARMVVSPGREERGILHMPSGQSGHPMSPHFRDGHRAWVEGLPTSFLPGRAERTLVLTP